jgi:hypothetical protein
VLRRANDASLVYKKRMFGKIDLSLDLGSGRQYVFAENVPRSALDEWQQGQRERPRSVKLAQINRTYWNFVDRWWWESEGLTVDEVHAQLFAQLQQEQTRAPAAAVALPVDPHAGTKAEIPDRMKQFVWTRDHGRCKYCGATTELQFEYIIPVALGGSTVVENLQLLCGPCVRRKSGGL